MKKARREAGDVVVVPPGVVHGWSDIPDHVDYLSFRPCEAGGEVGESDDSDNARLVGFAENVSLAPIPVDRHSISPFEQSRPAADATRAATGRWLLVG